MLADDHYRSPSKPKTPLFPRDVIFGAATSAFQIEGAAAEDGRGPSVWDVFSDKKGRIKDGDRADEASFHYSRYVEDVSIMGRLGLDAYRFSVSWPRILPEGTGSVNQKGLDFYDRLTDELCKAGIRPFATLFHWDYPAFLFKQTGGFLSRKSAHYFADYAEIVVKKLGDRVKDWITLNEPWINTIFGYMFGYHAPGLHRPLKFGRVVHNQLLAHAYAMERIKSVSSSARVGITLDLAPVHPAGGHACDRNAAHFADDFFNGLFLDPLLKGHYPQSVLKKIGFTFPEVRSSDMDIISRPMNFIGVNNYSRFKARFAPWVPLLNTWIDLRPVPYREFTKNDKQYTSMGWEVYPESLYESLMMLKERYGNIPVYITENGAAFTDSLADYRVRDRKRIDFLSDYTAQAARAADEGCDLRGYFVWSLLDNFEWAEGFRKRFGIVHVDYKTGRRTIKDSGYWYRDLITANRR